MIAMKVWEVVSRTGMDTYTHGVFTTLYAAKQTAEAIAKKTVEQHDEDKLTASKCSWRWLDEAKGVILVRCDCCWVHDGFIYANEIQVLDKPILEV